MIFNLSNFNFNNVLNSPQQTPTPSIYSNIKFFGEGNFVMAHGLNYIMTQQEIDDDPFWEDESWGVNSFFLAKFDNNLQAGNITSLPEPIESWIILRKAIGDAKYTKVDELPAISLEYVDRLARSNETYTYQFVPKTATLLGAPLQSNDLITNFTRVVLLDPNTNDAYSFCLDLRLSSIATDEDISFNQTRGKYDTVLKGNREVHSGSIGTIIESSAVDALEVEQNYAFLQEFENFLLNGEEKILKMPYGQMYRVATSDISTTRKEGNTNSGKELYVISFSWTEVGEV